MLGHRQGRTGLQLLLAYTSSGPWRGAAPGTPLGVIEFDAAAALEVNQRPFHLDLRCLARVLMAKRWFPRIEHPDRGVVAVAGPALRDRIFRSAGALAARSPQLIEIRGVPP